jgi:UDP-N-acetylmuramoylalanine--D-glutamate ligase
MDSLRDKRVCIVGLGTSGVAAARLCVRRGARVVATDAKSMDALSVAARDLASAGVTLAVGGHAEARLAEADLVVISPGVPSFAELEAAERARVPIWGEVELATRMLAHRAPIVAVGGTNGKSTTTSLVGALLEAAGKRVFTGGNLGEPLADHADETFDVIVLEVSSFQMERVDTFHPKVSVLLNVTPDHLDRYPSEQAYADAKGNSFLRQTPDDVAVVPRGDDVCLAQAKRGRARIATFGPGADVDVQDDAIVASVGGRKAVFDRNEIELRGGHNALNVAASIAAIAPFDVDADAIRRVLREFRGLPHRTAFVAEIAGVRFYDDSKGTNVGASVTALVGMREPKSVLIAGGRDKGGSYEPLVDALRAKGRAVVVIGEAADAIARAVGGALPLRRAKTIDDAVRASAELAKPGDAVLLSPACSSFDMFRDYKHRGDEFVRAVNELASKR